MAIKVIGVTLFCILSIGVVLGIVVPSVAFAMGFGISIPGDWIGYQKLLTLYSHPWISLLVGTLILFVLGWGVWRLARA